MDYSKLQNGSDIRGTAIEGVDGEHVDLTKEAVISISRAFISYLKNKKNKEHLRVAVGRDSRLSGQVLLSAACDGIEAEKAKAIDCGMASTPAMFMSTILDSMSYDGAIMITASHMPYNKNGMKFFTCEGGLDKADIKEIIKIASDKSSDIDHVEPDTYNLMDEYSKYLRDKIIETVNADERDYPLRGYHIVVDAGNGAGGFFVDKVLNKLGADTSGSRFLDPDGHFPNHIPNPENKDAMASIVEAVEDSHADLGIIFDTDVDRAGAVVSDGKELNRNRLIAAISAILLRDHPGTTIVTDSVTSTGLADFISAHGGIHRRFKRGYRNVIDESIRLNKEGIDSQLAMETSGHGALKENYFMDDGAFLCVKLLIEIGRGNKISKLIQDLREPLESSEARMKISLDDFRPYGEKILDDIKEMASHVDGWLIAPDNHEGVRVSVDKEHGNGWFLIRMSLHEPLMPLNIESDSIGGVKMIAKQIEEMLSQYDKLDKTNLKKLIH